MMKYAGMMILIFSTTATGVLLCDKSRKKVAVCRELAEFCDLLLLDLEYRVTPAKELVENALKCDKIRHLDFISSDFIIEKKNINSVLSNSENAEISQFMYSLGKTDLNTQKILIKSFKEYIKNSLTAYSDRHKRDSKLYVSFGLFFGIVFSLIWS